jgi:hypothetical protein
MQYSVSLKKATNMTNIKHNNREFTDKQKEQNSHINFDRSNENIYLVQEDLKELYEREFSEPLQKYNDKQKRNDRKIDSYYDHIKNGKKTALQQEIIVQVGDKDDTEIDSEFLEKWFENFQERNPNLKVYNAVIHNDEATPHLHVNFVPVASGYKRGLEKQVSFDRAIKQQDETLDKQRPFEDWRDKEVAVLEELLLERGHERKLVGTNDFKDVNEYKEKMDLERELIALRENVLETAAELNDKKEELDAKKQELEALSKDITVKMDYEKLQARYETKEVKVPSGHKYVGLIDIKETVTKKTGNVVLPKEKFDLLIRGYKDLKKANAALEIYTKIPLVKENKKLKKDYAELKKGYNKNVDDYNDLLEENKSLKEQVQTLKQEIKSIYHTVKDTLKRSIGDSKAIKNFMSVIARKVSEDVPKPEISRIEYKEQMMERKRNGRMSR